MTEPCQVVATNVADGLTSVLQGARNILVGAPEPSPAEILAALEEHGWNVPLASRALALSSRFVLNRLMNKHRIRRDG